MIDQNKPAKTETAALRPMDGSRLDLIARLSPEMAPIVSALSYPDGRVPADYPAHSSAFETLNATHPRLAQAISVYVRSDIHHGESFDKLIEDASRALFGLAPMNDADETAWMHRKDMKPGLAVSDPARINYPFARDQKAGPTVAEWVNAGYKATDYPPVGYNIQSTPAEVDAAVAAERRNPASLNRPLIDPRSPTDAEIAAKKASDAQIEKARVTKTEPHFMPLGDPARPEPHGPLSV